MNRFFILTNAIFVSCLLSCEREPPKSSLSASESETTVEPATGIIPLTIEPEIVEFDEIIDYGVPIDVSTVSELGTPISVVLTESNIETPLFSNEEINAETIPAPQEPNKASHSSPDRHESK